MLFYVAFCVGVCDFKCEHLVFLHHEHNSMKFYSIFDYPLNLYTIRSYQGD